MPGLAMEALLVILSLLSVTVGLARGTGGGLCEWIVAQSLVTELHQLYTRHVHERERP